MDLRQLRHFAAVADELHFGRAAERLNMTQPPLSQSIRQLELELGVQLFERTRRKVALTPVGRQWLPEVRRVLTAAADLPVHAERLERGETGRLRLAFVSTAAIDLMPPIVRRFRELAPDVEVTLREATGDQQVESLLAGDLDAGFMITQETVSLAAGLSSIPLHSEPLVAAVPATSRLAGSSVHAPQGVSASDLAEHPLILFPRAAAPALHDLITGYVETAGLRPQVRQEAVQMQTIVGLVAAGLGAALVPASMTRVRHAEVAYLPLADNGPVMTTSLVWRAPAASPTLRRFLDLVADRENGSAPPA